MGRKGDKKKVFLLCDVMTVVTLTGIVDVDPVWMDSSFSFWPSEDNAGPQ
jgi:hypothetical protein